MHAHDIVLPTRPRIISSSPVEGVFEIGGLYPGYGVTVGNIFRRILLSSLPGAAVTQVKIDGVQHEFSTLPGVVEDVVTLLLHIKQLRFHMHTDEPQHVEVSVKGSKKVTGADLPVPSTLEVANPDILIATLTGKQASLQMDMVVEKGLGYVPREMARREKVEVGMMTLDALFSPIRRVRYEVENMRVGERTDYNRLRITIQTDGTITPEERLKERHILSCSSLRCSRRGFNQRWRKRRSRQRLPTKQTAGKIL